MNMSTPPQFARKFPPGGGKFGAGNGGGIAYGEDAEGLSIGALNIGGI